MKKRRFLKIFLPVLLVAVICISAVAFAAEEILDGYVGSKDVPQKGELFYGDERLADEAGLLTASVNENFDTFYFHNSSVQKLYIGKDVTEIEPSSLATARQLQAIVVDPSNAKYCNYVYKKDGKDVNDGVLYEKDSRGKPVKIAFYPLGKTDTEYKTPDGVTTIGSYAVSRQEYLYSLELSEGVTEIEDYAFFNSLSVYKWRFPTTLPAAELGNRSVFSGGSKIGHLVAASSDMVKSIPSSAKSSLVTLEFLDGITSYSWNEIDASQIYGIQEFIFPKTLTNLQFNYDSWIGIDNMFRPLDNLRKFQIDPDNPAYATDGTGIWDRETKTLRTTAKASLSATWEIPDEIENIGPSSVMLYKIEKIYIGKNVRNIADGAFMCSNKANDKVYLREFVVSEENPFFTSYDGVLFDKGITRLIHYPSLHDRSKIFSGSGYFNSTDTNVSYSDCYIIPNTVKRIDTYAFYNGSNAPKYILVTTGPEPGENINDNLIDFAKQYSISMANNMKLYFPENIIDFYKYQYDDGAVYDEGVTDLGVAAPWLWTIYLKPDDPRLVSFPTSLKQGEGNPFYIKYKDYGTSSYLNPNS